MEFSCYRLETINMKRDFIFVKNEENIIYMKILYYITPSYISNSYIKITLSLELLKKYYYYYMIYKLSLFITRDIHSIIKQKYTNLWNIYALCQIDNNSFTKEFLLAGTLNENPYNIDFYLTNKYTNNILNKHQDLYSNDFINSGDVWLNFEIIDMIKILDKIQLDIDKHSLYIIALPYIQKNINDKQDIIDCIWKYI
jgi:hypothetical protein